jgi:hypothetical protein
MAVGKTGLRGQDAGYLLEEMLGAPEAPAGQIDFLLMHYESQIKGF